MRKFTNVFPLPINFVFNLFQKKRYKIEKEHEEDIVKKSLGGLSFLKEVVNQMSLLPAPEEFVEQVFASTDTKHDGVISFEEFKQFVWESHNYLSK